MSKPELLYISPVVPYPTGNGISMRAYHHIVALSSRYSVRLLVAGSRAESWQVFGPVSGICREVAYLPILPGRDFMMILRWKMSRLLFGWRGATPFDWYSATSRRLRQAVRLFSRRKFDVVHAFRLFTTPYADLFWEEGLAKSRQMDLDDIESETRMRLSDLYRRNGNRHMASQVASEARFYERIESRTLAGYHRVFVCSPLDRDRVGRKYPGTRVEVLPNVIALPERGKKPRRSSLFVFLFVGSLGYYPNADGVLFFIDRVLPLLRKKSRAPFAVRVVGGDMDAKLAARLAAIPEVELTGWVEDIESCYENSDAAIIPIRAGGGTRIKALEAFAHGLPVVSTPMGVEGLPVEHERDVLTGDSEEEFAEQCHRIMIDGQLRRLLIERASSLVQSSFHPGAAREVLCGGSASAG